LTEALWRASAALRVLSDAVSDLIKGYENDWQRGAAKLWYAPVWRLDLADIFDEVDEEVRKDQFSELWKKYGKFAVTGATVALVAAIGYVQWQEYRKRESIDSSTRFDQALALIEAKKNDEANTILSALATDGTAGYALLARFRGAGIKAEARDHAGAAEVYDAIAADDGVDKLYRDLANVLSIMQRIETGDPEALSAQLKPLTAPDAPWRFSALELAAILALRQQNTEAAKTHFKALADDALAPSGMRRRASEMLQAIDGS
jgi:hypothetical protein